MKVKDFDFELPEERIAQTPLENREASKLMIVDRETGAVTHQRFSDISAYIHPGDCLVLNNTKVLPARLFGEKMETRAQIELLLLKQIQDKDWEVLARPAKRVKVGTKISFGNGLLIGTCLAQNPDGGRVIRFSYEGIFYEILEQLGEMPLPPYIHEKLDNCDRYQTVYAKVKGSAAAPTAGLHFTEDLLNHLQKKGVEICFITLHVGLGTFRPVNTDEIQDHQMHAEYYEMNDETAQKLNQAKKNGKKIIAVGTTSTRTLETIARKHHGIFQAESGWTDIFIYPGYRFQGVDAMVTNFHLPKSTLFMQISAFASREYMMNAYQVAIENKYRFFSFGDAMLIGSKMYTFKK